MNNPNLAWWTDARLGLSMHFGLFSVAARGEWVRSTENLTVEDYQRYFDCFNPELGWATRWAALAKASGARHAVLTTKHHDGFCLFDSALTAYKATNSPAKRDLVREWVDAVRSEGLRVGLYYSLVDWHHPDFPAAGDRQHPLRHHPDALSRDSHCDWSRYVAYLHGQLIELCTHYGGIDQLIVDFSYWDYNGERWGATEIQRRLRALQPHLLFNDRWGREPRKRIPRPSYAGDYEQTEQNIPREGLRDDSGEPMPWEAWFTVGNSWSFNATDRNWKSSTTLIHALVNCVSKNGNLLLDASPDARGRVPAPCNLALRGLGEWLSLSGEAIYGAGASSLDKPEWGRFTRKGRFLYAHVLEPVIGHIALPNLRGRVANGRLISHNAAVILTDFWNPAVQTFDGPDDIFFNFANPVASTYPLPDPADTVVRFELLDDATAAIQRTRLDQVRNSALNNRRPFP